MSMYGTPVNFNIDLRFKEVLLKLLHNTTRISIPVYYQSFRDDSINFRASYYIDGTSVVHILLSNDERRRLLREIK